MASPDRWQLIESIFHAARERPPAERLAFLDTACAGDRTLRGEVESLLRHHGEGVLLESGAVVAMEPPATPGSLAGARLGPYVFGALLGVGGMGEVYRARDTKLGRDVAIKILPPAFASRSDRLARFAREARVLAALNHPNIGAIYGFEEDGALSGLILELLDGDTLATRLASGPAPIADALAYGVQIADALAAAHAKGIIHRDLKPANVALSTHGVKVIDFGLAKTEPEALASMASITTSREGLVVGSAQYMSPEQARGASVDARTDIWAFGCVLYEMLTGTCAFPGESIADAIGAVINKEPDYRALPAETPSAVRRILQQCLAKDPSHRPATMSRIRDELDAARRGGAPSRWRIPAAAAALIVVAALAVWFDARLVRTRSTRDTSALGAACAATLAALVPEQLTTSEGFDGFLAFSPDNKSVAFSSDRGGTMEIYVQSLVAGAAPTQLTNGGGHQNIEPAWSPDGQYIAYHDMAGGGIWVVPSRGGLSRKIVEHGSHPTWSPDGRLIAFQSLARNDLLAVSTTDPRSAIWTAEVDGPNRLTQLTIDTGNGGCFAPTWMPDGKRVLFVTGQIGPNGRPIASWWSVDKAGGRATLVSDAKSLPTEFGISTDGRTIYYVPNGARTIWSLPLSDTGMATGAPTPTGLAVTGSTIRHLAISRDGRRVGWMAGDLTNNVWSLGFDRNGRPSESKPVRITDASNVRYGLPLPAPDGHIALIGTRPGVAADLYVLDRGDHLRQLTADAATYNPIVWAPGGREIAILAAHNGVGAYAFLDAETGRERPWFPLSALPVPERVILQRGPEAALYAISPDLRQIALTYFRDGVSNIWLALLSPSGPKGTISQRTIEKEGGGFPSWSHDGEWISYQCTSGADTHLCVVNAARGDSFTVVDAAGTTWVGGWMPDNDRLLFAARRDAVWNVGWVTRTMKKPEMLTRYTDPHSYVRYPRWDDIHHRVVFERSEMIGRLWMMTVPDSH
jgi:Tol biopolymer transport system component